MRKSLDLLYTGAGFLAGLFVMAIVVLIMAQIIGRWFGILVPSTEDFSGWFLGASSFLALAYTLRTGGHIRVNILIRNLRGKTRYWQEIAVLVLGLALACFMTYWLIHMVWESYVFNERSRGYISVDIWMVQVPVAVGAVIFNIAMLDELVHTIRTGKPSYHGQDDEMEELEELLQEGPAEAGER
ncbi:TRAP transporter small permease [Natronospirillum operosum]|uniref:TRAP transporter small permease protein n=1 Tax=Natronospirillum operosum TaxID=2759953 RepID=A0A4Z0WHG1_9GAMM|nr:TRAP transporter small permease [Natronospirillum operosum]TGG94030.1 TRAP transporter small permease [Natronospirillum operosum]